MRKGAGWLGQGGLEAHLLAIIPEFGLSCIAGLTIQGCA